MAFLQLKNKPIRESLPVANCRHDEHTTAQKYHETDAKQVMTVKSEKHLTQFYSHESESPQHGKHTIATGRTKVEGKKEANKELYAATYDSANMGSLKPMKAEQKIKEKKKKREEEKKKSKSKDDSGSSSESEDDVSKKKGGKEKKH